MTTRPSKAQNMTIVAGALFVLFLGVYAVAFSFVKKEAEQTSLGLEQVAQGEKRRANLETFKNTLEETAQKRAAVDALFLTPDNVIDFISNIEGWGTRIGVRTVLSGLREEGARTLSFSVQAEGSFEQVMNFLELLENLPHDARIDDVNLVNQSGAGGNESWKGTFAVRITSYNTPEEE